MFARDAQATFPCEDTARFTTKDWTKVAEPCPRRLSERLGRSVSSHNLNSKDRLGQLDVAVCAKISNSNIGSSCSSRAASDSS